MSISKGVIVSPVSIDDVKSTIGVSSSDLGYLCSNKHGQINKWARYKPIDYNRLFVITDEEMNSVFRGFTFQTYLRFLPATTDIWQYNPPTGGSSSPYRIEDFIKYKHSARTFLKANGSTVWKTLELASINIGLDWLDSADEYEINYGDLFHSQPEIINYYLAIVLYDRSRDLYYIKTATDRLGFQNWDVIRLYNNESAFTSTIPTTNQTRYFDYWLIACNTYISTTTLTSLTNENYRFIPLPYDIVSDNHSTILQDKNTSLIVEWSQMRSGSGATWADTVTGSKVNIADYETEEGKTAVYTMHYSGDFVMTLNITNPFASSITLPDPTDTILKFKMEPGMNSGLKDTGWMPVYHVDPNSGARLRGEVSIEAGQKITVYIGRQNLTNLVLIDGNQVDDSYSQVRGWTGNPEISIRWGDVFEKRNMINLKSYY